MRLARIVAALVLAIGIVVVPRPAAACACGAMMTSSQTTVSGETALVIWDGARETISMSMVLRGAAQDAGWVMPVPKGTEVSLGDKAVFPLLVEATKPVRTTEYDWNPFSPFLSQGARAGAGGGAPPVQVDKVAAVGPFQVTWLSGTEAAAVNAWVTQQGYPTKPAVIPTFQSYLDQGWQILAVKLQPAAGTLEGALDPLVMSFATTEPVYPILLSRHASYAQGVNLYVVAPHRMDIAQQATPSTPLSVRFAGRVPAATAGLSAGLGAPDTVFLTAYSGNLQPSAITADYRFRQAADDTPYVTTIARTEWAGWVWWVGLLVAGLAGGAVLLFRLVRPRPAPRA